MLRHVHACMLHTTCACATHVQSHMYIVYVTWLIHMSEVCVAVTIYNKYIQTIICTYIRTLQIVYNSIAVVFLFTMWNYILWSSYFNLKVANTVIITFIVDILIIFNYGIEWLLLSINALFLSSNHLQSIIFIGQWSAISSSVCTHDGKCYYLCST